MARTEDELNPEGSSYDTEATVVIKELLEQHVCSCQHWVADTKDTGFVRVCFPYSFLAFSLYLRYHVPGTVLSIMLSQ